MSDIFKLIAEVIEKEGGYSNHPADRGGPTRWGITQVVAQKHGYMGDMRRLPKAKAIDIYHHIYWLGPALDTIATHAPRLAAEMFDTAVNMGTVTSIRFLQRSLNAMRRDKLDRILSLDGAIGNNTIRALQSFLSRRGEDGETVLIKAVDSLQGAKYIRLAEVRPANRAFIYGWLANRVRRA